MSVDREYTIKIATRADVSGANEAKSALDGVKKSAADINTHLPEGSELWAKYKDALSESGRESGKLEEHHKVLKFAMQQLGLEIPGLELLLKGMFNPATVAVVGIAGAWKLWNERIEHGVEALSGMKLPDLSEHIGELSVAAKNADTFARALRAITDAYYSVDAVSDRVMKKIETESEAQKKLVEAKRDAALEDLDSKKDTMSEEEYAKRKASIATGATAEISRIQREQDEREHAETARKRDELRSNAQVKREAANRITVASAKTDEANLADAKAQADAAKEAKKKSQEWINTIAGAQDSTAEAFKASPEYYMRYGFTHGSEAIRIEQGNIANADVVIKRYEEMLKNQPERDAMREHRQRLLDDAGKMEGQASILDISLPQDASARAARQANQTALDLLKNHPEMSSPNSAEITSLLSQLRGSTREGDRQTIMLLKDLIKDKGSFNAAVADLASQLGQVAYRADRPRQ